MLLKFGMEVLTAENEKVGELKSVIIDPAKDQISDLIIQKGFLFPTDKIVPFSLVVDGDGESLQLREFKGDIEDFQDYRERDFVPIDNYINNQLGGKIVPLIHYSPLGISRAQEIELKGVPVTSKNLKGSLESLKEGMEVVSLDGEKIGKVKEIFLHPTEGRITHILAADGVLIRSEVLIPAAWIENISDAKIRLYVNSSVINMLPDFRQEEIP